MKIYLLLLLTLFALSTPCVGERRSPSPYVTVPNWRGEVFFTMIPGPADADQSEAFGVCYGTEADGSFVERWRVEGWFSWNLYLSLNGEFLVRLGDWASNFDGGFGNEGLAIAFYKRGEELKRYKISDLVEYKQRIGFSSAGPQWIHYNELPSIRGGEFQLDTVDELRYRFDLHTGEIVSKVRLEPEKLPPDLTPEERVAIIWGQAAMDSRELLLVDVEFQVYQNRLAAIETRISTYAERIRELSDQDSAEGEKKLRQAHEFLQRVQGTKEETLLQRDPLIEEAIQELRKFSLITESRRHEVEEALRSGWMPTENPYTASRYGTRQNRR